MTTGKTMSVKLFRPFAVALIGGFLLSACGSHDSNNSGSASGGNTTVSTGRFIDDPVQGLQFESPTQKGLTGTQGEFFYIAGETVRFLIGDVEIGRALGAAILTPQSLVSGAQDTGNRAVINIARVLLTLDSDCDASNGIQINAATRQAGMNRSPLNFDQTEAAFSNDAAVMSFVNQAKGACTTLMSGPDARANLDRSNADTQAHGGQANRVPALDDIQDITVAAGTAVTLTGVARDADGDTLTYAWSKLSGPTITPTGADTPTLRFTAPASGPLLLRLVVTDGRGGKAQDDVKVLIAQPGNQAPVAVAGADQIVDGGINVTLDGSGSSDADGSIAAYQWEQIGGASVGTLSNAGTVRASFIAPNPQSDTLYTFRLTVTDNVGDKNSDDVVIRVRGATVVVPPLPGCVVGALCAGAAKSAVTPLQSHIDGVDEVRFQAAPKKQKFNLGGYGINPFQNLPDPVGQQAEQLTIPAKQRVFTNSKGKTEDLWLRVLVLEQPGVDAASTTRIAFVTLDATGAGNVIQQGVKTAIVDASKTAGAPITADNILFGQTHTHAGPDLQGLWGGVPQDWISNTLNKAAATAVKNAIQSRKSARLSYRQGVNLNFNNYRRPKVDKDADSDGTLTLLTATGTDGSAIGSVLQYNAHPTSVDETPRTPHPDFILGAMEWLEDASVTGRPGGVALYYNGPIADASGSGSREGCINSESADVPPDHRNNRTYGDVRCRGEGIADAALNASAPVALQPTLSIKSVQATLPVTNPLFIGAGAIGAFNRYYNFTPQPVRDIPVIGPLTDPTTLGVGQLAPTAQTTVSRITIGGAANGLEIVTIPGEATNTFGQYVRGLTPNKHMMFLGLTHNSFGYIIPEEEFSYVDPSGDAGFVVPFTGYEEFVSLGPLTAPMLRLQAYNPLFDIAQADPRNLPPSLIACQVDPASKSCAVTRLIMNIDYVQRSYAQTCRKNGLPEQFCAQLDPELVGAAECRANGLPSTLCDVLGSGQGGGTPGASSTGLDPSVVTAIVDAQLRGCDLLDPAHCLYPFPSDQFTVPAAAGSPQSVAKGGTGKRVNFNLAAMPRNTAGKPIDPTEWNRNDGFSPGSMILAYVPNIGTLKDTSGKPLGPITGAVPLTDLNRYKDADAPILLLDATTGERYPVWAEIDVNAGFILPAVSDQASPLPKKPALIVRPAKNFIEGHRYVVVLRNLKDDAGKTISAQTPFRICRDGDATLGQIPVVKARCDELKQNVFPVLTKAGIALDASLYLSWDFTVASAANDVSRLVHMRDDAFASLGDVKGSMPGQPGYPAGNAPSFEVTDVTENPDGAGGKTVRRIRGTFKVPSYVIPADPSPADGNKSLRDQLKQIADQCEKITGGQCGVPGVGGAGDGFDLATSANLPPNRLFYRPDDGAAAPDPSNMQDPVGVRYGDGMPDRNPTGDLTTTFTCDIPRAAVNGKSSMADASSSDVKPVRPTVYGHGLLGGQGEVNGQASDFGNVYGFMNCAIDWFGFASGDLPNVASVLVDLSNFPVVPDSSQQGMLNQMFLARLMVHPNGFAGNDKFQVAGKPVFDRREVFYHGNSQGGILGGVLVAASKDINRGVLGVLGMNYSTLLSRSTDFATYSIPLYLSYQDDLDRPFVFALMQMLWDRSENNGYAAHLTDNSAMGGSSKQVLLQPSFGDHQVSMWTADVMARTVGARVDRHRIRTSRHPDTAQYALLEPLDYSNPVHRKGSALVPYDQMVDPNGVERWNSQNDTRCDNNRTSAPPIGNKPPGTVAGDDPHECPRRDPQARCQMSHFLLAAPTVAGDSSPEMVDVAGVNIFGANADTALDCPAVVISNAPGNGGGGSSPSAAIAPNYGGGLLGVLAQFFSNMNPVIASLLGGDLTAAGGSLQAALTSFGNSVAGIFKDPSKPESVIGLDTDVASALNRAKSANRDVEAVVVTGAQLPGWSSPAAQGAPYPYPSGANVTGQGSGSENLAPLNQVRDPAMLGEVRNAHNGVMLYPQAGVPSLGVPTNQVAAYAYKNGAFVEIPVQVDEKYPFFLANAGSTFSVYSGTDEELTYAWDQERWDPGESSDKCSVVPKAGVPDPVAGLDDDDEVVFMAADAGDMAPQGQLPQDVVAGSSGQQLLLADPLDPSKQRYVYLFRKAQGSSFKTKHYVSYQRDANADQWIDRYFFRDDDPEKIGTSNTGYGPNLKGTVCQNGGQRQSVDRFPRDGVSVSTDTYHWRASGRWMVRDIRVKGAQDPKPQSDLYWSARPDLIDRWKGRAFQQSPDSTISVVGFEDEQVNWEANSIVLGERCGPVRCIREVWGADSGTNVTKTETFYRDAVAYRFHVRVHPIPPDGLYTSWDYNRGAMVPTATERAAGIAGGRYYTVLRPQGVPIDGVNDDIGQVDTLSPIPGINMCITSGGPKPSVGGKCPAFLDVADPSFNLPLAFANWEQVSGKGGSGSLVYTFELKGATSLANPAVVPFYRDDACLDDGTGDDPVSRPWPGEASTDQRVKDGYAAQAGKPYDQLKCEDRQGDYGSNGIHYFVTHDSDNAFAVGKPIDEIDGQQWQFMVPTDQPKNVGETYANVARFPLKAFATPINPGAPSFGGGAPGSAAAEGGLLPLLARLSSDAARLLADAMAGSVLNVIAGVQTFIGDAIGGVYDLAAGNPRSSATATGVQTAQAGASDPASAPSAFQQGIANFINGYTGTGIVRAGVAVVDMTPDVGYCSGQYCASAQSAELLTLASPTEGAGTQGKDPFVTAKSKQKSYGVQSRLSARAIVVEGTNGKRVALLKSDNYLAQDALVRRVAQILQQGKSGIGYDQILYGVTHNHSAAYSSSAAAGVALFEDVYDLRFFENQARKLAQAIELAAAGMVPARMGATTIRHTIYKGNVVRLATADDGTPAGYPLEYNDHGLVVMRFDNAQTNQPLAVWINWGEHPESLDGYSLHSADYLAPLERWVQRELGVPLVFSQGDVGSSENTGNAAQMLDDNGNVCGQWAGGDAPSVNNCPAGQGTLRDWNHKGYAQTERNVRFLADAIRKGWDKIGANDADVQVPMSASFVVDYRNAFVPGPLSHPYPSVSNCRTETTANGNAGVPAAGLPDCARAKDYGLDVIPSQLTGVTALAYATAKAEGVPVPDHYDAPAFSAVEENARIKLQTVRLGEVLLASCACEAQNDLILNLESRTNDKTGDIYDGFDWTCLQPQHADEAVCKTQKQYYDSAEFPTSIPGSTADTNRIGHMRAQIHNDARGWDLPQNVTAAVSEPTDISKIWGNFTKEELSPQQGYKLPVGVGHAGDYNGYTVSYREYMNRDSYRKALTAYGPHTADYMVSRLVRMAGAMKGAPELQAEPQDTLAQADEVREKLFSTALGQASSSAYDAWQAALPMDVGPALAQAQPANIKLFNAATYVWRGGNTQVDNPMVKVQHKVGALWQDFADMTGEVQTKVTWPAGYQGVVTTYAGQQAWIWTANFEAYEAFPARLGSTPLGSYRFVVKGCINDGVSDPQSNASGRLASLLKLIAPDGASSIISNALGQQCAGGARTYELASNEFRVEEGGVKARSYSGGFAFINDNNDKRICNQCSFRPWARPDRAN
jgi:hypothetical protein